MAKNLHICNQYIIFNNPIKISFLDQRVLYVIFFQNYTTHSRSVYDPIGMMLAIFYKEVSHMFLQNISQIGPVVLEKKSFEWLLPYIGIAAILNFDS